MDSLNPSMENETTEVRPKSARDRNFDMKLHVQIREWARSVELVDVTMSCRLEVC